MVQAAQYEPHGVRIAVAGGDDRVKLASWPEWVEMVHLGERQNISLSGQLVAQGGFAAVIVLTKHCNKERRRNVRDAAARTNTPAFDWSMSVNELTKNLEQMVQPKLALPKAPEPQEPTPAAEAPEDEEEQHTRRRWTEEERDAIDLAAEGCGGDPHLFIHTFAELTNNSKRSLRSLEAQLPAARERGVKVPEGLSAKLIRMSRGEEVTVVPTEQAQPEEPIVEQPVPEVPVAFQNAPEPAPSAQELMEAGLKLNAAVYERLNEVERLVRALAQHLGVKLPEPEVKS